MKGGTKPAEWAPPRAACTYAVSDLLGLETYFPGLKGETSSFVDTPNTFSEVHFNMQFYIQLPF